MKKIRRIIFLFLLMLIIGYNGEKDLLIANAKTSFASLENTYPSMSKWNSSYKSKAWECHGFACMIADKYTDTDPYTWTKVNNFNSLKPGDLIRFNRPHSILVTGVSGDTIEYVDCNRVAKNTVKWHNVISRNNLTSRFGSLSAVWVSPSTGDQPSEPDPVINNGPVFNDIHFDSIDKNGFTLSCSVGNCGLVKVNIESVDSGKTISNSYTSDFSNISCQFNVSSLPAETGRYNVYIYAYSTQSGGNETLHKVTYGDTLYMVTLPSTENNISGSYLLDPLVFDYEFYARLNPDLEQVGIVTKEQLESHWVNSGAAEGRWGCATFNSEDYLVFNSDLKASFGNDYLAAIRHFLQVGISELRAGSRLFSGVYYRENNTDVANMAGSNYRSIYEHFVSNGLSEGRAGSDLYNPQIYLSNYEDLRNSYGNNQYKLLMYHWLLLGDPKEHRNASELIGEKDSILLDPLVFNLDFYQLLNSDLESSGITSDEDLINHWLKSGYAEGRIASPVFSVKDYLEINSDLKKVYGNDYEEAIRHFLTIGLFEKRESCSWFNCTEYAESNSDVKKMAGDNVRLVYEHAIMWGVSEGRKLSSTYDPVIYLANYADLQKIYKNDYYGLLEHYILMGIKEKRNASKRIDVIIEPVETTSAIEETTKIPETTTQKETTTKIPETSSEKETTIKTLETTVKEETTGKIPETTVKEETTEKTSETTTEKETTENVSETSTEESTTGQRISLSLCEVYGIEDKVYTGKPIKQDIEVYYEGEEATVKVVYYDNVEVGTATVLIKGTGIFKGTLTKKFKITKAKRTLAVSSEVEYVEYSSLKKKNVRIYAPIDIESDQFDEDEDEVTYTNLSTGLSNRFKINKSSGIITVRKGTKKGNYKLRIKVTLKGNSVYKTISKKVTVKIKVK